MTSNLKDKSRLATSARALSDFLHKTQADGTMILAYINGLNAQPDIDIGSVAELPRHQATAREHGTFWFDTVAPKMGRTVTDVTSFGNTWKGYYDDMTKYAHQIASTVSGNMSRDDARDNLASLLRLLDANLGGKAKSAQDTYDTVRTFDVQIGEDLQVFKADLDLVHNAYAGPQGEIAEIKKEIPIVIARMCGDVAIITAGTIVAVGGIVMICIGAAGLIATAGMTCAVILAGVGFTVTGASAAVAAAADFAIETTRLITLLKELKKDQAVVAGINMAVSQIDSLATGCSSAVASAQNLFNQWGQLKDDFAVLGKDIRNIKPGDYTMVDTISYANQDWMNVLSLAERIQSATAGGAPPLVTNSLKLDRRHM